MPQPRITGTPPVLQFGGLALPNGQGTASQINLNDLTSWTWMGWNGSPATADDDFYQHVVGQSVWRAKGSFLGQDAKGRTLVFPMRYREATNPLGVALQQLASYGAQNLALDASSTAVVAKYAGAQRRQLLLKYSPYYWGLELHFQTATPWWADLSNSTVGPQTLNSGSATNFNATYNGGIFSEPVWTLTIPVGNTAPIASFTLANTMSGETLSITFPGNLPGSTAATVTIDCGAMTVVDGHGVSYDVSGSFPKLYPPVGQVNTISATLTPASGTATSCTIAGSWFNRWLI